MLKVKLEKITKLIFIIITLMILGIASISCNSEVKSRPNFVYKPAPKAGIAVKIAGREINYEEFYSGIEGDIFEAEQKLYEIKIDRIKAMLLKELMEKDPRKVGLTNDEFLIKYISKNKTPSSKDIDKFIEEKKIPKENINDEVKDRVKKYLEIELKKSAVDDWLTESTKITPVEIYFEKPKRSVFNITIGDSPAYGAVDAKVTIILFADYQCPFTARGFQLLENISDKYGKKKIKVVFKHYPLSYHVMAYLLASASMCIYENDQDNFWKFSKLIFQDQTNLSRDAIKEKAKKSGISSKDMEIFEKCMDGKKFANKIDVDLEIGRKIGVKATPTFFINGKMINGIIAQDTFEDIIDEELAR
ncbi:MAG: DsbA family protein [Oligoflexia bacterium]|nr:DsbA family protein [Oligoflexia bacterium]